VIPYGINNAVPQTALTSSEAKKQLGIQESEKTILFFGAIKPYKGLEYLVAAFQHIATEQEDYRLIIAGERKKGCEQYWSAIQQRIGDDSSFERVLQKIGLIPDQEMELYFKAADVAVLPYTEIFQSGILILAYSFGLPVVATDVGSFAENIIAGKTGLVCRPGDPDDLAGAIRKYFDSDLFRELEWRRQEIRDYALSMHSWDRVGDLTRCVYLDLVNTTT
jgi:glycosyltransferase involved in cell wall biosynthesis